MTEAELTAIEERLARATAPRVSARRDRARAQVAEHATEDLIALAAEVRRLTEIANVLVRNYRRGKRPA